MFSNPKKDWLNSFAHHLRDDHYRYKKNIGEFLTNLEESTVILMLTTILMEDVLDELYNLHEKNTPPEEAVKIIVDKLRQKKKDLIKE